MASCKFENGKYHTATEAKAHFRHDDISIESRRIAAKGNPNIDVTKSNLNRSLLGLTYEQMCQKYDERIAYLDATTNTNRRKDRVTLQNIEIPVPAELDRRYYNKWFVKVADLLCDLYGRENFIEGQIHYDEEHEYMNAETGELTASRVHAHFSIVPEIKGILNCKKMSGRNNMRKLNSAVDNMTKCLFNCSFMTGEKKKSRQTVDELKNKSNRLALQQREQAVVEAENRLLESIKVIGEQEQAIERKKADLGEYERLGVNYYNRAMNLCNSLEREDKEFQENKASLYKKSLESIGELHTKLDESLLPRQCNKQKEKQMSR